MCIEDVLIVHFHIFNIDSMELETLPVYTEIIQGVDAKSSKVDVQCVHVFALWSLDILRFLPCASVLLPTSMLASRVWKITFEM